MNSTRIAIRNPHLQASRLNRLPVPRVTTESLSMEVTTISPATEETRDRALLAELQVFWTLLHLAQGDLEAEDT
jgi:hypothetical protein